MKVVVMIRYVIFLCLTLSLFAADSINIDFDWKFSQGDFPDAKNPSYNDSSWRNIDLPHDWSIEGKYEKSNPTGGRCGYLPTGIGWYRKTIDLQKDWFGKNLSIDFDGIFRKSDVYVDGKWLGNRPYGWISFSYDLTPYIQGKKSITIAVRVDNSLQHAARWYSGSGIYSHCNLTVKQDVSLARWGSYITSQLNDDIAEVSVRSTVENRTNKQQSLVCELAVFAPNGKHLLIQSSESINIEGKSEREIQQNFKLDSPRLWDIDNPNLYKLRTTIKVNGLTTDSSEVNFGIRTLHWDRNDGFFLNGKQTKIHGMCMHIDAGPLGAAVPDGVLKSRLKMLKDMGCNSVRTSHYPRPPVFYDICDRLGIMVMDEIFDGWGKKASQDYGALDFAKWWQKDLTDWIIRDRNHPSIIIWSVGNETHGDDIAEKIVTQCHKLDPTRLVTSGSSGTAKMDVFGENGATEKINYDGPKNKPFIGTECVHTWHVRGMYRTQSWYRDGYKASYMLDMPNLTDDEIFEYDWASKHSKNRCYNSSYDNSTVRDNVRHFEWKVANNEWISGSYRWTAFDYIGEADYISGGWPFKVFNSGVIDIANFKKDPYYLYQSMWTDGSKTPMLHLLPHWTHPTMKRGTLIPVQAYSNCEEVKLFVNGKFFGSDSPSFESWDQINCQWMVPWQAGELKAQGFVAGEMVCQEVVKTASIPAKLQLSTDNSNLKADRRDIAQVVVSITDSAGNFYPYGENRIYYKVFGPAEIKATGNGCPNDVERHNKADRKAFMGLSKAYVKSNGQEGDISVWAASILGEPRQITSKLVSIDVAQISLRGCNENMPVDIYYTTDDTKPDEKSARYAGPFEVSLGTNVRAAVYCEGAKIFDCLERFDHDMGLSWAKSTMDETGVSYEAEDAEYKGAIFTKDGKNFSGTGYLDFKSKEGIVQWSITTDGGGEDVWLLFHYAGKDPDGGRKMRVVFNNEKAQYINFPNTENWNSSWQIVKIKKTLKLGSNTIKLSTAGESGMNIDKLEVVMH